jgi:hypothetical protein
MKMLICLLVLVIPLALSQADVFNISEQNFVTPEAATQHFVSSIAKNNVAFAINEYADTFDFKAHANHLQSINIYRGLAPTDYNMYKQLNRLELLSKYAFNIKLFTYSFYSSEPLDGSIIPLQGEPERLETFVNSVNPEQLGNLTIERAFRINALSDRMKQNWQAQAAPVGADEVTEMVVLYNLNGSYFLGGFSLLRYGENWKISGLSSVLAGMESLGGVSVTTPSEFEAFAAELGNSDNWTLEELPQ